MNLIFPSKIEMYKDHSFVMYVIALEHYLARVQSLGVQTQR